MSIYYSVKVNVTAAKKNSARRRRPTCEEDLRRKGNQPSWSESTASSSESNVHKFHFFLHVGTIKNHEDHGVEKSADEDQSELSPSAFSLHWSWAVWKWCRVAPASAYPSVLAHHSILWMAVSSNSITRSSLSSAHSLVQLLLPAMLRLSPQQEQLRNRNY